MLVRTLAVLAVAFAGFLPAVDSQQKPPKDGTPGWAESFASALEEAKIRNVPIFITIQQDNNPACTAMEGAFRDGSFIKGIQRCVPLVANGEIAHGTRDAKEGNTKVAYCKLYEGIKCDHHTMCNEVCGLFFKGEFGVPSQVWLKPDPKSETGYKELFKVTGPQGTGAQSAGEILKDMDRAIGNIAGKSMSRKEYWEGKKLALDGEEAFAKGEYKRSIDTFKKLKESKSEFFAKKGDDGLKALEQAGLALVEDAAGKMASSPKDAKELLAKIAKEFDPAWDCVKKAKELLAKGK